jgi:hypothetical protein
MWMKSLTRAVDFTKTEADFQSTKGETAGPASTIIADLEELNEILQIVFVSWFCNRTEKSEKPPGQMMVIVASSVATTKPLVVWPLLRPLA